MSIDLSPKAYGDWVRAQASRTNTAASEIIQEDVKKYPYNRKENMEVRIWQLTSFK